MGDGIKLASVGENCGLGKETSCFHNKLKKDKPIRLN